MAVSRLVRPCVWAGTLHRWASWCGRICTSAYPRRSNRVHLLPRRQQPPQTAPRPPTGSGPGCQPSRRPTGRPRLRPPGADQRVGRRALARILHTSCVLECPPRVRMCGFHQWRTGCWSAVTQENAGGHPDLVPFLSRKFLMHRHKSPRIRDPGASFVRKGDRGHWR